MPTPAPHKQPHQTQWEKVKLGDILDFKNGKTIPKELGKYPCYGGNGLIRFVSKYNFENVVIIGRVGEQCGSIHFEKNKCWVTDNAIAGICKKEHSSFLYYLLIGLRFNKIKIGSSQPLITQSILDNTKVEIPPLPTQKNIAQILSTLDKKIELNTRINTELESMAKLLYTRYFVEFNFPDSSGKPYKASGGAMVYSPTLKREIPQDWEVIKLANRFNFERGEEFGTASYKESKVNKHHIKFYRVGDMIDDSKCVYVDSSKENAPLISENDLLVSFDGSVGRVAYGLNGTYSSGIRKITDKHGEICQSGLYFIFTDSHIQHTINQHATGTNIKHAGSAIENLYMPYSKEVFSDFQNKIHSMFALMRHTKAQSQRLAEWRDYLLPLLMGDQVEVV